MIAVNGQMLQRLREEQKLSINKVSDDTGVPRRKIRLLERGEEVDLKITEFFALAQLFGLEGPSALTLLVETDTPDIPLHVPTFDIVGHAAALVRTLMSNEQRNSLRERI